MFSYINVRHVPSKMLQTEDEVQKSHVLVDLNSKLGVTIVRGFSSCMSYGNSAIYQWNYVLFSYKQSIKLSDYRCLLVYEQ